jgi:hypothetical protein
VKADVGLVGGRIAGIGKAGNPDIQPGVDIGAAENLRPSGSLGTSVGALNAIAGSLGYIIVAFFVTLWVFAVIKYRHQTGEKAAIRAPRTQAWPDGRRL